MIIFTLFLSYILLHDTVINCFIIQTLISFKTKILPYEEREYTQRSPVRFTQHDNATQVLLSSRVGDANTHTHMKLLTLLEDILKFNNLV